MKNQNFNQNNMSNQSNALEVLKTAQPTLVAITAFNYGEEKDVTSIVANEISYLEGMAITKPELYQCDPRSIVMAMKYVLKNNLSFDPNAGLVYTKTRNVPLAKDAQGNVTQWGKVIETQPTCEGLLSIAYQCGKILDHERPEVKKDAAGKVIEVTFKYLRPSFGQPRWVEVSFDESDFHRWRNKSHAENGRGKNDASSKDYSNINYRNFNNGIDPEFARAKAIRHALKKLGTNPNERLSVNVKPSISNTIDLHTDIEATEEEISDVEVITNNHGNQTATTEINNQPEPTTESNLFTIPNDL